MELIPHVPGTANGVTVSAVRDGNRLRLTYQLLKPARVALPASPPGRADGLWRHTCFEAFVSGEAPAYLELNFAPSGAWAAYAFDDYRAGMGDLDVALDVAWNDGVLTADVAVPIADDWRINLTAVIEENDGTKSYWALAHPDGPPDFHDPACFVLDLPAVG